MNSAKLRQFPYDHSFERLNWARAMLHYIGDPDGLAKDYAEQRSLRPELIDATPLLPTFQEAIEDLSSRYRFKDAIGLYAEVYAKSVMDTDDVSMCKAELMRLCFHAVFPQEKTLLHVKDYFPFTLTMKVFPGAYRSKVDFWAESAESAYDMVTEAYLNRDTSRRDWEVEELHCLHVDDTDCTDKLREFAGGLFDGNASVN